MNTQRNPLERAFELAKSSECRDITEIKRKMASEGYSLKDFVGSSLPRQLRAIIQERKTPAGRD